MTDANVPDDVPSGDEEDMMRLLGLAVAQDQVPDQVVAAAKGSYTWRTIDADARIVAPEETRPKVRFSQASDVRIQTLNLALMR